MSNTSLELVDEFLEETPGYDLNDVEYEPFMLVRSHTLGTYGSEWCVGDFDGFISINGNVSECDGRGEYNIVDCGLGALPLI
jgi:hypothetical protein